jgi:sulfate transport system ATP-binding protein
VSPNFHNENLPPNGDAAGHHTEAPWLSSPIFVRELSKRFGSQGVLKNVSFEIAKNEMLVILGPSGSGKTTLLRILAGLETPDSGDIYLQGRLATKLPPQARGLGVVFQEQALFQKMSVERNIGYGLKLRHVSQKQIRETVREMLELTRLQDHSTKLPSQLSGGQRQRVALARALAFKPEALLFDEPFSALDAVTRTELRREVRTLLKGMNVAALFITHDQEEALELADRIAVLNDGRIEQIDSPFEIYNHPCSEFIATFIGAANVLFGRWREGRVVLGRLRLHPPTEPPFFAERQPVKVVFRPEDTVLNFQLQLLNTPHHLGSAVVEDISYAGATERLVVRLTGRTAPSNSSDNVTANLLPLDETFIDGLAITITRTKWEANDMTLSIGDPVVVGLKDYRLLPHYPLRSEGVA